MPISKGEVWLVNLDPTIGDEIRKMRPAVVVNRDALGVLVLRLAVAFLLQNRS
jgi:mRNA interferase MazF